MDAKWTWELLLLPQLDLSSKVRWQRMKRLGSVEEIKSSDENGGRTVLPVHSRIDRPSKHSSHVVKSNPDNQLTTWLQIQREHSVTVQLVDDERLQQLQWAFMTQLMPKEADWNAKGTSKEKRGQSSPKTCAKNWIFLQQKRKNQLQIKSGNTYLNCGCQEYTKKCVTVALKTSMWNVSRQRNRCSAVDTPVRALKNEINKNINK